MGAVAKLLSCLTRGELRFESNSRNVVWLGCFSLRSYDLGTATVVPSTGDARNRFFKNRVFCPYDFFELKLILIWKKGFFQEKNDFCRKK